MGNRLLLEGMIRRIETNEKGLHDGVDRDVMFATAILALIDSIDELRVLPGPIVVDGVAGDPCSSSVPGGRQRRGSLVSKQLHGFY